MSGYRLSTLPYGALVTQTELGFTFDRKHMTGLEGDTLASALLANGETAVGRSFKYHRARGIWGLGFEEPNALVELRTGPRQEPNTQATRVELFHSLIAKSQNNWPSPKFDLMAINQLFAPLFVAGFYYKTFMWPSALWEILFEPAIRRAAGLGRVPEGYDPDTYQKQYHFCDVLVVGSGPSGLMAALTSARAGLRVTLIEDDAHFGGRLLSDQETINDKSGIDWVASVFVELQQNKNVTLLKRTSVFGVYDHGVYGCIERVADHVLEPAVGVPRQRFWQIQTKHCILATGAIERPIAFPGNDRPGVMSSSAVRGYASRYGVASGRKTAVFTSQDDGWHTAKVLQSLGAEIAAVIDVRSTVSPELTDSMRQAGIPVILNAHVADTEGRLGLKRVVAKTRAGATQKISADCLAVAGGWNPVIHLASHQGQRPSWNADTSMFLANARPDGMEICGSANGVLDLAGCLASGAKTGSDIAAALGRKVTSPDLPRTIARPNGSTVVWHVGKKKKVSFVDFQHDVTVLDIDLAAQEGFDKVEHLKRYTTLGMATDQGKTSNVTGLAIVAEATNRKIAEVGTTVFRPPFTPATVGAIAGGAIFKELKPNRYTPTHDWATRNCASFVEASLWHRAEWYTRPGEKGWRDSVDREALAVRKSVGFADVSTLGKIEVVGRDAGAFLDFVYANMISTLEIGRVRYGLMLRDDGFVLDDGTVARLGPQRFFITTSTVQAPRVMQHMEFCHQVYKPELQLAFASTTDCWSQFSIAGPRSRDLIAALVGKSEDVSNTAFPHMSFKTVTVDDMPARLFRLSFSGELAYEIAVRAEHGEQLVKRIQEAGTAFDVTPYGLEAMNVLRIEKGHVTGAEINGMTTAGDLGIGGLLSKKKDFIGRVMCTRQALTDANRPVMVGLKAVDASGFFQSGAHLFATTSQRHMAADLGYITSTCFSPHLGHEIGLGMLRGGKNRQGEKMVAHDPIRKRDTLVEVCSPVFLDPEQQRAKS